MRLPPVSCPVCDDDIAALEQALRADLPRFAIRYKDESTLQKVIARIVWPFNRHYMTRYTTVMFGKVYFPSRVWCEQVGAESIYCTLRHEAIHLQDMRRFPILFQVSYLFLLPAGITARAFWEWRGYAETIRAHYMLYNEIPDWLLDHVEQAFTGSDYLYMFPFRSLVRRQLEALRKKLLNGSA